jgi:surface protein
MLKYQNKKMSTIHKASSNHAIVVTIFLLIAASTTTMGANVRCNLCRNGFKITNPNAKTIDTNLLGIPFTTTCKKLDKVLKKGVTKKKCRRHQVQETEQSFCDCKKCFESNSELRDAVLKGYSDNATPTGKSQVTSIYGPIEHWCVEKIEDFTQIFAFDFKNFNEDISHWSTSKAKIMLNMFVDCLNFNGDLSKWDVSNVSNMDRMFLNAVAFNSDLSKWDVGKAKTMYRMFFGAKKFNSNISDWNVKNVVVAQSMFLDASAFNQNLCSWKVQCSTDVKFMFFSSGCTSQEDPTCPSSSTFCQPCE